MTDVTVSAEAVEAAQPAELQGAAGYRGFFQTRP